jgi:hypothetical protein
MAYPVAMETLPALPRDIWERTPPEVQTYIRALEACVSTLEAMVEALQAHEMVVLKPERVMVARRPYRETILCRFVIK